MVISSFGENKQPSVLPINQPMIRKYRALTIGIGNRFFLNIGSPLMKWGANSIGCAVILSRLCWWLHRPNHNELITGKTFLGLNV